MQKLWEIRMKIPIFWRWITNCEYYETQIDAPYIVLDCVDPTPRMIFGHWIGPWMDFSS